MPVGMDVTMSDRSVRGHTLAVLGALALVAGLLVPLSGCDDRASVYYGHAGVVENLSDLDLPTMPSNEAFDRRLSSSEGISIRKVGGAWMWRNSYSVGKSGGVGYDTITVNVRVYDKIVQRRFDCDDMAVVVMHDVTSDEDAYMTYGDGETYAYIVHIPEE